MELNAKTLNDSFKAELAIYQPKLKEKANREKAAAKKEAVRGFFDAKLPDVAADIEPLENLCDAWPKMRGFINFLLGPVGWAFPAQVAMVKAFLSMFNKSVVPMICGNKK